MRTEEEIREELKQFEEDIKDEAGYLAEESYGYILALKWVLEEGDD